MSVIGNNCVWAVFGETSWKTTNKRGTRKGAEVYPVFGWKVRRKPSQLKEEYCEKLKVKIRFEPALIEQKCIECVN